MIKAIRTPIPSLIFEKEKPSPALRFPHLQHLAKAEFLMMALKLVKEKCFEGRRVEKNGLIC